MRALRIAQTKTKAAKVTAADRAYARILDLILTRELRPNERTSVNLLADRLSLGRTPIKEAITRLETEGVLTVVGQSGTMVNGIGSDQVRQIFSLRRLLEDHAVKDVVRNITAAEIAELRRLLTQMRDNGSDETDMIRSGANFVRANIALHSIIVAAARNSFLDRLYSQLQVRLQVASFLVHRGYNPAGKIRQHEHEDILAALERRDANALRRTLRAHAKTGEALILRSLAAWPPGARPESPERNSRDPS